MLCIVETPADVLAIEASGAYQGWYFVLLGRLIDFFDWEMLEDLIAAAINDAVHKVEKVNQDTMQEMTAGLSLPPGFKLPF